MMPIQLILPILTVFVRNADPAHFNPDPDSESIKFSKLFIKYK